MAKSKTVFLCSECGADSPKWQGRCPSCGAWDTLSEYSPPAQEKTRGMEYVAPDRTVPVTLASISGENEIRTSTGISELDRVLGGGMVRGSFILLSGEPGIGKSTLLLQVSAAISKEYSVLYITGEESLPQIKLRAERLEVSSSPMLVYSETRLDAVIEKTNELKPDVIIVDSIQTLYNPNVESTPGSITQVRECSMSLMRMAKSTGITVILVGHVNKDGVIAGPKVLEHMVDTVLNFEGDRHIAYRILKGTKNRFGSTNETGVFEMTGKGLAEVLNPSQALLSGRPKNSHGSCVAATIEGTRPLLTEVQALVTKTSYGSARRTSSGIDYNRAVLLIAILEKRAGFMLSNFDAYINVIGGLTLDEPAVDLAVLLAIASSYLEKPVGHDCAAFGEVGLSGEIRAVSGAEHRANELLRLGFTKCILPAGCKGSFDKKMDMELVFVENIRDAITACLRA